MSASADAHAHQRPSGGFALARYYFNTLPPTRYLLLAVPVTAVMAKVHAPPVTLFIASALAVLSLVTAIGKATEEVSLYTNPTVGGLLNATFGNVTELIIAVFALRQGLHELVKASVVGSILGNLLFLLGAAMIAGGTKYQTQTFSRTGSSTSVALLALALIAIVIPAVVAHGAILDPAIAARPALGPELLHKSSVGISVILLVVYALSLLFSLKTHRSILSADPHDIEEHPEWSLRFAIAALLGVTVCVAWVSDVFVEAIEALLRQYPVFTHSFMGVIVVALVGNAAEGSVAIWVARENKMELSFQVAMGSCIQVALFVAPMLVLMSQFVGPRPMNLDFNVVETVAMWASVLIASLALQDGESNWFEGVMFLAVYVMFGLVFFFHP